MRRIMELIENAPIGATHYKEPIGYYHKIGSKWHVWVPLKNRWEPSAHDNTPTYMTELKRVKCEMSKLWHDSGVIDDEPSLWPGERDAINLSHCRADEAARITGLCVDGKPCGSPPEIGDDRYCAECPNIPQSDSNQADAINPSHYTYGGIETIDYMKAKATPEEYRGHLRLTALKYLSRAGHKDEALQEYRKARWYLERLIGELEQ